MRRKRQTKSLCLCWRPGVRWVVSGCLKRNGMLNIDIHLDIDNLLFSVVAGDPMERHAGTWSRRGCKNFSATVGSKHLVQCMSNPPNSTQNHTHKLNIIRYRLRKRASIKSDQVWRPLREISILQQRGIYRRMSFSVAPSMER